MKRIGFDIDGTISMNDNQYKLLRKLFNGFDETIHFTEYPLTSSLLKHGYIEKGFDEFEFFYEYKEIIFGEGTFYPEFKKLYTYLKENEYEIYFVTARNKNYEELTKKLFELNNIPFENVYHLGTYNKVGTLKELGIELFFEDNVNNINQILNEMETIEIGFIEAPYNKTFNLENERLHLFRNWENVLNYFKIKEPLNN